MAEILSKLVVEITADDSQFKKSLGKIENTTKKVGKSLSKNLTLPLVLIGSGITKLASDFEETNSKFNTVFSNLQKQADLTAKNFQENFGQSELSAKKLLSSTGDLLTGFGFTQDSALNLSRQVNELAIDLASFTNFSGGAEGASQALTKALLGERESIKSLGIAITEADIKRLAEDKGLTGELDRQTKAMLTLELAVSQSKNAIGDFSRTQDSVANQTRVLKEEAIDLAISFGQELLPVAKDLISVVRGVVERFSNLDDSQKKLIVQAGLVAAAIGPITTAVSGVTAAVRVLTTALATNPILLIATAAAVAGVAIYKLTENTDETVESTENLKDITEKITTATAEYNKIQRTLTNTTKDLTKEERLNLQAKQKQLKLTILENLKKFNDERARSIVQLVKEERELSKLQRSRDKLLEWYEEALQFGEADIGGGVTVSLETIQERLKTVNQELAEQEVRYAELKSTSTGSLTAIAQALNDGIITQADLATVSEATKNAILAEAKALKQQAKEQKQNNKEQKESNESKKEAKETADEYEKKLKELEESYKRLTEATKENTEAEEENNKKKKEFAELDKKLAELTAEANLQGVSALKQKEEQLEKLKQKYLEVGQTIQANFDKINSIITQVYDNQITKQNNAYENEIANIEKQLQAENLSTEQKKTLEEQLTQKKEEQANEIAKIKEKQFKAEKAAALGTIAIETAKAVLKVFPNPYLIALAGTLGAAQAAVVASQPIPKFRNGGIVENQGAQGQQIIAGDGVREFIVPDNREYLGELGQNIVKSLKGRDINNQIVNDQPIYNQIVLDSKIIQDVVSKGTRNRTIKINKEAII